MSPLDNTFSGQAHRSDAPGDASGPPAGETRFYPLTSQQRRVFFLAQTAPGAPLFNLCFSLRLRGKAGRKRITGAIQAVIRRHSALRVEIKVVNGEPYQTVTGGEKITLTYMDLSQAGEALLPGKIEEFTSREARRAFTLVGAPLARFAVLKLNELEHVILFTIHHLVSDGASLEIIRNEFVDYCLSDDKNQSPPSPPAGVDYMDYVEERRQTEENESLRKMEDYWLKEFSGAVPELNLPLDFKRPPVMNYQGEAVFATLDKDMKNALLTSGFRRSVPLFSFLLAAYYLLLSKYCAEQDIVIGALFSGRPPQLLTAVGFFVNTVAVHLQVDDDRTVEALLSHTRDKVNQAYDNQDYPLEYIVEKTNPHREASRHPLFQVMFNMQKRTKSRPAHAQTQEEPAVEEWRQIETGTSQYDLTLHVIDREDVIDLKLEYNTALFRRDTVLRLLTHYAHILQAMIAHPDRRLSQIELMHEEEKNQVLYGFNATAHRYPCSSCAHRLFEEQALKRPDKPAVVCEDVTLTYGELNARANQLAGVLREKGVGTGSIVALMAGRGSALIAGILAILKAGGVYMPVDPALPANRISYMLSESAAKIILADRKAAFATDRDGDRDRVVFLDDELGRRPGGKQAPQQTSHPDDPAYLIYTSGSTGRPKGVLVRHRGIANLKSFFEHGLQITEEDRILQFAKICFDASVWEIFMGLLTGATLYTAPDAVIQDVPRFERFLNTHAVTVATLPPTYLSSLNPERIFSLKKLVAAGSESSITELARWRGKVEYINAYGPTETTVCATTWKAGREKLTGRTVPIGKPIINTRIYILDRHQHPVPVGVPGEIYISGVGVADSYLNRPDLTAQRFMPDPFHHAFMMYKTGDQGRWLPDGNVEFLGRVDRQVKIRGYRIETGEIENQLLIHGAVREAYVTAKDNERGDGVLCAYYTAEKEIASAELRRYLARELPDYMLPAVLIRLDKLPLTYSGKVDDQKLPSPRETGSAACLVPPGDEREKRLYDLWREVLQRDKLSIHDNFFDVGGNSLNLMKLSYRIQEEFAKEAPLVAMLKYPTIHALAGYLAGEEVTPLNDRNDGEAGEDGLLAATVELFTELRFK